MHSAVGNPSLSGDNTVWSGAAQHGTTQATTTTTTTTTTTHKPTSFVALVFVQQKQKEHISDLYSPTDCSNNLPSHTPNTHTHLEQHIRIHLHCHCHDHHRQHTSLMKIIVWRTKQNETNKHQQHITTRTHTDKRRQIYRYERQNRTKYNKQLGHLMSTNLE